MRLLKVAAIAAARGNPGYASTTESEKCLIQKIAGEVL